MIRKAIFNSDVINDNDNIYFPIGRNIFELARFPIFDNMALVDVVREAVRELKKGCYFPKIVFLPFARYNNEVVYETENDVFSGRTLLFACEEMGLQMLVMTPDCFKDKIKVP